MSTTGKLQVISGPEELGAIIDLDREFFSHPWLKQDWLEIDFERHILLSWCNNQGFALFGYLTGDATAHLYKILLHPSLYGQGQSFWSEILKYLKERSIEEIYLEVESTNERAINFYQKVGFKTLRRVKGYYSQGTDGIMMQLTL